MNDYCETLDQLLEESMNGIEDCPELWDVDGIEEECYSNEPIEHEHDYFEFIEEYEGF